MRIIIILMLSLLAATNVSGEYSLPSDRSVDWQGYVGSTATIPSTGNQITCTQAPYNVPTDGVSDTASAIRSCLNGISSGQVAYLPAGTYLIKSSIYVPSNKVLRGAGMGVTTVKAASSWSGWGLVGPNPNGAQSLGSSVNISGTVSKGTTTIITSSSHGLSAGNYVIIDQLDDPSGDPPVDNVGAEGTCTWCGRVSGRSLGQINKVVSIVTTTSFTVETPLYWDYTSSSTAQVTKQNGMIVNAGVESLTLDNSVIKDQHVALLWFAANCWFYDVEVNYTAREGLSLLGYRNTIRSSKIHETSLPLGPNSGYGIWGQTYASGNLIEDNIIYNVSNPIILNGQFSGNVIAYNYLHAHDGNTGRQNGAFSSHGAHPIMNLIEGNYLVGSVSLDFTWGSSSHYTFFRNLAKLQLPFSTYVNYKFLMLFHEENWYQNVIGNILWNSGEAGTYICSGTLNISTNKCVYALGYTSTGSWTQVDSSVESTILRHGNYDYVNNAVQWNGSDDHTLPDSLYLTSKPSWYGTCTWPPVVPSSGTAYSIPAKLRYEEASCEGGGSSPSPSSGSRGFRGTGMILR